MSLHPEVKLKAPALIEVEGEADPGAEPFDDIAQGVAMEGVRRLMTRRWQTGRLPASRPRWRQIRRPGRPA